MTSKQRHPEIFRRRRRRLSTGVEAADTLWRAYHRYVFKVCAVHLSPSEDLAQYAITAAEPAELARLVKGILDRQEHFKLPPDAVEELTSVQPPSASDADPVSPHLLREVCVRVARRNGTLHPFIVDFITDHGDIPDVSPPLPAIVNDLARIFALSEVHVRILIALYGLEDIDPMSNLIREASHRTQMNLISDIAETDLSTFARETAAGSTLERLGLLNVRGGRDELVDIGMSRPLLFALRSNTLSELQAGLFDETPPPQFTLADFTVSPEEARTCAAALRGRHPLLITGEPGIGKTEFARTLTHSLGLQGHTLAAMNRASRQYSGHRGENAESSRFNAIRMAVTVLSPDRDVLIIDEADTILQSAAGFFNILAGATYDKAILNDLLENLPVATIWITNEHRMIPASALRRFGHVYAFPHPSIDTRMRMLSERFLPLSGETAGASANGEPIPWTRDLAARYDITPAAIDRAARIITAELNARELHACDVHHRITGYMDQVSSGALAHDVRRLPTAAPAFDPRFCSTSEPLDRIERQAMHRARTGSGLRLLFGGPPGGGKTQYALWLAKQLGRDVVLKRPSDLLAKYVGESEQQIAEAFRRAAQARSVLIIDEADALLYDRSTAQRSWEHSQIAEFLQQIQEYSGILIACTNRVDAVDPALRRRFHKHVTFGPIGQDVLGPALEHIFPDVSFAPPHLRTLQQGPPLMMSDLATAAEMLEIENLSEDKPDESPETVHRAEGSTSAIKVVEEILSNARSRDRTREIGF